ncbi:restriction endonuclease [Campylobacter upsaliensis]|nr:restriction endonuclease [Campylobacter upsaliensis]EAJ5079098.1 restriction endonuclease [Campylobacter upsaliensis]EHJ5442661.1 restriction endonuclease [Campylobacter upsaliensis]
MRIEQVKTAFKIADVEFVSGSTKLNFNYLKDLKDENGKALSQKILSENVARVYLIVVDDEIKKWWKWGGRGNQKHFRDL